MKAAFYTLGCKVNQNETDAMEEIFRRAGYEIVDAEATADIYVVNSCTVTAGGDTRSRQWLRRARRQNPQAVTVLTGCFPQAFPEKAQIPEADVITGTAQRATLLNAVETFLATNRRVVEITPHSKSEKFEELPTGENTHRTRATVKIQDGCNRRCTFCIIPQARGKVRSRSEEKILAQLETLAARNYREVVFTGINLPSYGQDTHTSLADIIEKSAAVQGIERLRLSSLDPDLITKEHINRLAAVPKFCEHFHLSLQSGCDATLRRMCRPYTTEEYRLAVQLIRQVLPHAGFTTDIIVGFPGETEQEFAQTLAFVEEMQFLKVHVFPFSPRPGTPAATFSGQVPKAEKQHRLQRLQATAEAVRAKWVAGQLATNHSVLLEKPLPDGRFTGYTKSYIPIAANVPGAKQGDIVTLRLQAYGETRCPATPV